MTLRGTKRGGNLFDDVTSECTINYCMMIARSIALLNSLDVSEKVLKATKVSHKFVVRWMPMKF